MIFSKNPLQNIQLLIQNGVPESKVVLRNWYPILAENPLFFNRVVVEVKELGFNPKSTVFIVALRAKVNNKSLWGRKIDVFKKWGWSEENVVSAFVKHPWFDVWKDLKERCLQGDRVRVATLYQEISNFKQGNSRVSDYFTEMRAMWEELDQFRPIPQCTCPYMSHVLLMEPLPNINKVLSMVLQDERQQNYGVNVSIDSKHEETEVLANAVENLGARRGFGRGRGNGGNQFGNNQYGRGRGNPYKEKVCTYCGKNGHIVDICYKKHGYPPNWGYGRGNQGNAYANNVEDENNEGYNDGGNMQMKASDEGNVSLTKD
ncbi:unnamed protein product [Trifolium pratense]|uniref:Uncharacterized protein n=1 Tax=Trifolium pratense TaxID=57577 RepID=A0ACB0KRQ9_TRIPR|nr:unnamed protein product [Trifolium pratense]